MINSLVYRLNLQLYKNTNLMVILYQIFNFINPIIYIYKYYYYNFNYLILTDENRIRSIITRLNTSGLNNIFYLKIKRLKIKVIWYYLYLNYNLLTLTNQSLNLKNI